jgi:hypothetical protein
VEPAAEAGFG